MEVLKERYSITELSAMLQITDHTLRFYEKELKIPIPKDERGRRYYTTDMANLMYKIKVMRSEGLEIKAIKKILNEDCVFETPQALAIENQSSLVSPPAKEFEAIYVILQEFGKQLTQEISCEVNTAKENLSKEILKSKLELGACVENSMRRIENKMEKHYEDVDKALGKWREKSMKRSKNNFFQKIFNRRY
jgi:DNA-binding transcriptional MerR regulator